MIYNDKITTEYGVNTLFLGASPIAYQPRPTADDYKTGYFTRWFSKRVNDEKATEIDPKTSGQISTQLYTLVSLIWMISGPKDPKIVNRIVEKPGVFNGNRMEIMRVKNETGIDLSKTLTNPLELWRGY